MKNTLIALFIATTLALGAVCLIQRQQLAAQKTKMTALRAEAEQKTQEVAELQAAQQLSEKQRQESFKQAADLATKLQARQQADAKAGAKSPAAGAATTDGKTPAKEKEGLGSFLAKIMEDAGLGYEALNVTYMPYPDGVRALASKAIDGFWAPEPWGARAEAQGVGVRFLRPEQVKSIATFQVGVIIFGGKFMQERPKVARDFLAAYVKGARYFHEKGQQDPEIVAILAKHLKVPPETVRAAYPFYIAPDGRPRTQDLLALQDFLVARGWMTTKVPQDKMVDLSFLP